MDIAITVKFGTPTERLQYNTNERFDSGTLATALVSTHSMHPELITIRVVPHGRVNTMGGIWFSGQSDSSDGVDGAIDVLRQGGWEATGETHE